MTVGMVLVGLQLLWFSTLGVSATFWHLVPGLVVGGLGMALTMAPTAAAAIRAVPVEKSGVGSAVLNSFRQVGGSLGIAAMGAIMVQQAGGRATPEAFVDGFSTALLLAAAVAFLGGVVAAQLVRPHEDEAVVAALARAAA